jgi:hypothetical protein
MEIYNVILPLFIGLLGLLRGNFKNMVMKDKIIIGLISLLMITSGILSYNDLSVKREKKQKEILKCKTALNISCQEIYKTIWDYNRNLKIRPKEAEHLAIVLYNQNGEQLERARNDCKDYIDSEILDAIDDALKSLKSLALSIIDSKNRKDYLYRDICKIDTSFIKYPSLYEYDSILKSYPIDSFNQR